MDWIIDRTINLSRTARENGWHLASVTAALEKKGLPRWEADAFAAFVFADAAAVRDGEPEEHLTDEQWERLSVRREGR